MLLYSICNYMLYYAYIYIHYIYLIYYTYICVECINGAVFFGWQGMQDWSCQLI